VSGSKQRSVLLCRLGRIVFLGVMLTSPRFLFAQNNDPALPSSNLPQSEPWWKGIATDGFMSFSDTYNTNDPIPRLNQFRVFSAARDRLQEILHFAQGERSGLRRR